jgi:ESS family glutamate:Na+ symporter
MDLSAANTSLWNIVIQFGIIAAATLLATFLRRKVTFIKNSLMPIAVLAGFLLLILRSLHLLSMDTEMLEKMTYHGIAIGFIAMSLRIPPKKVEGEDGLTAAKSGALIVSTYLIQALVGFAIVLALAYTIMPNLFKAAGILLPMGYGQGPGQANNVGTTYESLGFTGGRSFALAIAAAGYLSACIVGVLYLNVLNRRHKIGAKTPEDISGSVSVDAFQDKGEIPISESIDKFSMQVALVVIVYLLTYLVTYGITSGLAAISPGLANSVSSILWGFNFIIGSALAMLTRAVLKKLRATRIMTRQYQNNYLLNRISGVAFDMMIIAGIASIDIGDLSGLWLPFWLLSIAGAVVTFYYLRWLCKKIYPGYFYEGFVSMYGMLTGTISSGVLLLREIDSNFETPAANNLITGSSTGILFGVPMLIFIGMAPKSDAMLFTTIAIVAVYWVLLVLFLCKAKHRQKKADIRNDSETKE